MKKENPLESKRIQPYYNFFREAHESINHVRKSNKLSYFDEHVQSVSMYVFFCCVKHNLNQNKLLPIALGHDYVEDVINHPDIKSPYSEKEYKKLVNSKIHNGIIELTNEFTKDKYPHLNRKKRKILELNRLSKIKNKNKLIKMCDRKHNLESFINDEKKNVDYYIQESSQLIDTLLNNMPKTSKYYKATKEIYNENQKLIKKLKSIQQIKTI